MKIRDDLPLIPQFTHGPAMESRNLIKMNEQEQNSTSWA